MLWTFLSNHAHVLLAIQRNPELRQREMADQVGVTLGAVQRIIAELENGGYLRHEREDVATDTRSITTSRSVTRSNHTARSSTSAGSRLSEGNSCLIVVSRRAIVGGWILTWPRPTLS